jgi:two-component sensor histidine kinase
LDGSAERRVGAEPLVVEPKAGSRPTPPSMRSWLVVLVMAVLTPAIILSAVLIWAAADGAYKNQERQLAATARAMALGLDRQLSEQITVVRALAASRMLKGGDYEGFYVQAKQSIGASPSWVVIRDAQGNQLMNTRLGRGETVTDPMVTVSVPITLIDGRPGTLNLATYASTFTENLKRQELPEGWVATILDGNARVVARNRGGPELVGRLATPDVLEKLESADTFTLDSHNLEGVRTVAAVDRLPDLRWTALIGVPKSEITGFANRIILFALLGGAALIAVSLLSALYIARRISRPVEALAQSASEWRRGAPTDFANETGLKETDSLSASLREARHTVDEHAAVQDLLINELNHRVKNSLATVQAIGRHSLRTAASAADFQQSLEGRVMAMSAAHELLTNGSWAAAELGPLARRTLQPFAGPRLRVDGPRTHISPQDALNLSLALYELATNAAKHGALSGETGEVTLTWTLEGGQAKVLWEETGGPAVPRERRPGFGTRLIDRVRAGLSPSDMTFDAEGVRCTLTVQGQVEPEGARRF